LEKLTRLVGEYNKLVAIRAALLGKYWHAMRAAEEEANRQAHLIASSVRLAQPQVVVEKMFPDGVIPARELDLCRLLESELAELSKDSPIRVYRTITLDDIQDEFAALCASLGGRVGHPDGELSMAESPQDSGEEAEDA
jgi:hypothetical protein